MIRSEFFVTPTEELQRAKRDHTIFGTTSDSATIAICEAPYHTFGEEDKD